MKDLIERDAAIHAMECEIEIVGRSNAIIVQNAARMIVQRIKDIPPADVVDRKKLVETIRHFKCPCKCEDYWYSWKPSDNWFCANGER